MTTELILERWKNRDGSEDHLWSIWADGRRVEMGGPLRAREDAEKAGCEACRAGTGRDPDRITRL